MQAGNPKSQEAAAIFIKLNGQTVTTAQKVGWRPKTPSGSLYFQTIKTRHVNSSDFSFFPPFEIAPMKHGPKPIWSPKTTDRFLAHLDRLQKKAKARYAEAKARWACKDTQKQVNYRLGLQVENRPGSLLIGFCGRRAIFCELRNHSGTGA